MGLSSLFQKKTAYFDKKITPKCGYCQYGRRAKSGENILCEKQGIMNEDASCPKFVYSPLKRIPVKQLHNEGAVGDEEMYVEIVEKEQKAKGEGTPAEQGEVSSENASDADKAPAAAEAAVEASDDSASAE